MGDPIAKGILRRRGAVPAAKAANEIKTILTGSLRLSQKYKKILRQLKILKGSIDKKWLRAVEISYNHNPPSKGGKKRDCYTLINFENTPYEIAHVESVKRLYSKKLILNRKSPLREDLNDKNYLNNEYSKKIIGHLEKATRFRPLTNAELASVTLTKTKRILATNRARGSKRSLAEWLFSEKNWNYLIGNISEWAPQQLAGFFEKPDTLDLIDWPKNPKDLRQGDKRYLQNIEDNILQIRKNINKLLNIIRTRQAQGSWAGQAGPVVEWAAGQEILEIRKKLHILRKKTDNNNILMNKLINIKIIWKKNLAKHTGTWRKEGLLK